MNQYKGKTKNTIKFEVNSQIGGHFKVTKHEALYTLIIQFSNYNAELDNFFVIRVNKVQSFIMQLQLLGWKRIKGVKYACFAIPESQMAFFYSQYGIEFDPTPSTSAQMKRADEMASATAKDFEIFMPVLQCVEASEFSESNFFVGTEADFVPCAMPNRKPDYISDSGSKYWYEKGGVIRSSNHWGYVASCNWTIGGAFIQNCQLSGFAPFSEFKSNSLVW